MSRFPNIPVRFLVGAAARRPEPPRCPDFGFPSVPPSADRCVHPWIAVYDAPCTEETVNCLLFRSQHFVWRQSKLVALLTRRPAPSATARAKFDWCVEVLQVIADLADDTNVAHWFLSGFGVPDHFARTRAWLNSVRPMHDGAEVPLMFPELWLTGSGDEAVPARASALGFHVLSLFRTRVDRDLHAYLWKPPGRERGYMLQHTRTQHQVEKPRPIPTTARTRSLSARDLSLHIFEAAPGPGDFLVGRVERATGGAPCLFVSPTARECFHYERFSVAIAGAEGTMDLLSACAEDWVRVSFGTVIEAGFQRYATYLMPYAESGQLALDPGQLREQIIMSERREAQAAVGTYTATIGAIAATVPVVGGIVAAVIAIVGAVVSLLVEVLPMAWGGGMCPVLGFRRTLLDPECAAPNPQGNPDVGALLSAYHRNLVRPAIHAAEPEPPPEPAVGGTRTESGSAWPVFGLAAVGAAALGYAAHRRRTTSKQEES